MYVLTYSKAQLIGEASEGVLLQEGAHELVNKAQLLTGTQIQEVRKQPGPLGAGAFDEVVPELGKIEVLVISRIAPVGQDMRGAG